MRPTYISYAAQNRGNNPHLTPSPGGHIQMSACYCLLDLHIRVQTGGGGCCKSLFSFEEQLKEKNQRIREIIKQKQL